MGRQTSLSYVADVAIARDINSQYDNVKIVADEIDAVVQVSNEDIPALIEALEEATDFTGITVVAVEEGTPSSWDPETATLYVETQVGADGEIGLTGAQGLIGLTGLTGSIGQTGSTGERGISGATGTTGPRGLSGDDGSDGSNGIDGIDGSDGVDGQPGSDGNTGSNGTDGINVDHLKFTGTNNPLGIPGTAGYEDLYTFYGDPHETITLGSFIVQNGPEATMEKSVYDTNNSGVVDNSEELGGKSLATVESERTAEIQAATLGLGSNYSVADHTERDALEGLTVSDKVFVEDDGDGKWAHYTVTDVTDGLGSTSSFTVIMDEDTYLNANSAADIKASYESNADTNAFTDEDETKVGFISVTQAVDLDAIETELAEFDASTRVFTNKTITDGSNLVHANAVQGIVQAAEDLVRGDVIVRDGITDDALKVKKRSSGDEVVIGFCEENIANGATGAVIAMGLVRDVEKYSVNDYPVGSILYPDLSGGITLTPDIRDGVVSQPIGYVVKGNPAKIAIRASATSFHDKASQVSFDNTDAGVAYDTVQEALEFLSLIQSASMDPTGWDRDDVNTFPIIELCPLSSSGEYARIDRDGTFTELAGETTFGDGTTDLADRTIILRPDGAEFSYWFKGKKVVVTETITFQCNESTGVHIFTIGSDGVIGQSASVHDAIVNEVIFSICYTNGNGQFQIFSDERHGKEMRSVDHERIHTTIGCVYDKGMDIEGLADAQETYTQTTSGIAWDEDLKLLPEQQSEHPFAYRLGSEGLWQVTTEDNRVAYSSSRDNGTNAMWNKWNGSEWVLELSDSSHDFIPMHFVITNHNKHGGQIMKIIGQSAYSSRSNARDAIENEIYNITLDGLPSAEFIFLYSVIVKRNTDLEDLSDGSTFVDFRTTKGVGSGTTSSSATYHPDLLERDTADSHPASAITNTASGNLSGVTVQSALNELQNDIDVINNVIEW